MLWLAGRQSDAVADAVSTLPLHSVTCCFRSPEAMAAAANMRPIQSPGAADVWSAAATILFLFTGRAPYGGIDMISNARATKSSPSVPSSVPQPLRDMLLRCFAFRPASRPDIDGLTGSLLLVLVCLTPTPKGCIYGFSCRSPGRWCYMLQLQYRKVLAYCALQNCEHSFMRPEQLY